MRRYLSIQFLIASVFLSLWLAFDRPALPPADQPDFESAPEMMTEYVLLNKKYFHNRLPKDTEIYWSKSLKELGDMGLTMNLGDHFVILLDFQMEEIGYERASEEVLIHEMAHIDVYPCLGHGRCFQKDMQRLARAGALEAVW